MHRHASHSSFRTYICRFKEEIVCQCLDGRRIILPTQIGPTPHIFLNVNVKVVHTSSCRILDALYGICRVHSELLANFFGTSVIASTFPNAQDRVEYIAGATHSFILVMRDVMC